MEVPVQPLPAIFSRTRFQKLYIVMVVAFVEDGNERQLLCKLDIQAHEEHTGCTRERGLHEREVELKQGLVRDSRKASLYQRY